MSTARIERALPALRSAKREYAAMVAAATHYEQGRHQGAAEVEMHRAEAALADELAATAPADERQPQAAARWPWSGSPKRMVQA